MTDWRGTATDVGTTMRSALCAELISNLPRSGLQACSPAGVKKTGPARARPKFASVGAPANHLPEGKKLQLSDCQIWEDRGQPCPAAGRTMQRASVSRNAAPGMPAMRCRQDRHESRARVAIASRVIGYPLRGVRSAKRLVHHSEKPALKLDPNGGTPKRSRTSKKSARRSSQSETIALSNSSAARWRRESRGTPARARRF